MKKTTKRLPLKIQIIRTLSLAKVQGAVQDTEVPTCTSSIAFAVCLR